LFPLDRPISPPGCCAGVLQLPDHKYTLLAQGPVNWPPIV
jgi:hypothetical protein